jgi:hypothetical protein
MAGHPARLTPPWWRRAGRVALLVTLALHALVGRQVGELIAPIDPATPPLQRIQAAYTRSVAQAEPPAPAAAARPAATAPTPPRPGAAQARALTEQQIAAERAALRDRALAAVQAASASQTSAEAVAPDPPSSATVAAAAAAAAPAAVPAPAAPAPPAPPAPPASAVATAASAAASASGGNGPASSASSAPSASGVAPAASGVATVPAGTPMISEDRPWPVSTRLSYTLHGWYNGDVYGQAQVEWLREGWRYQVHLDVAVGPRLAPLMTRRMTSEGRITERGLVPQRYLQVTQQIIGRTRTARIGFEDAEILLDRGNRVPQQADVQDTASQFIQMIYLFTAQPALQEAGRSIEFPLAMPHRVDRWTYDVGRREPVTTPVGVLEAFHVKPRRAVSKGDLSVEVWYAPRLQLLPVRILIRQDENTWVDLQLEKAPEQ